MYLLYVGLTYKTSPFSLIEKIHFSDQEMPSALKTLKAEKSVLESVIISTCNRTELYLVVDQLHTGRYYARHFLANWFSIEVSALDPYLIMKEEDEVLEHLLRLSLGLESKILGETQVLGQLKRGFQKAQELGTTGAILNEVSRQVITFAKRMHGQYQINARPISIGLTAIQILESKGFSYEGKTIAVIGLGEIGQLVAKYGLQRPFEKILLLNRTMEKGRFFLGDNRVSIHGWDALDEVIAQADVVFSAVKVEEYIIFPHMLKEDAIVFDLCLPRTVHPKKGLCLYTIENLTNQLDQFHAERNAIAEKLIVEIKEELVRFYEWRQQLGIVHLIKEIREKALEMQVNSLSSLKRKLPDLTLREEKLIAKHMKGIINQLIKEPILQVKELSIGDNASYDIALFSKIFNLGQEENKDD
ncbi:glutamyl-tRNA reductase [Streptococcus varani]|uniref:Glutamyl-tRNA reductase n=1 Tax=Streptococcus varani TaxID=1608583 RepID=A0A0E3WFJ2_9STRE|nr:glutamyl-tRNA reductase [Streptococcus varani]CQR25617.1 glutamyl-tRNA reductase [Streptococcus varani]